MVASFLLQGTSNLQPSLQVGAQLAVLAVLVALSALFSAAEAAILSVPAYQRRRMEGTQPKGRALGRLFARPNRLFVTVHLGNDLVNAGAAVLAALLAIRIAGGSTWLALVAAVLAAATVLIVLGEFLPRALATVNPQRTARSVAPVIVFIERVLRPVVWAFERLSAGMLRLLGAPVQRRVFVDEEDLKHLVEMGQAQGLLEKEEQEMISAVIDFSELTAREVMVPRTDMVCVEDVVGIEEIVRVLTDTGYSRIPVYRDNLDEVVGVVYGKDVLGAVHRDEDPSARQLMKQAVFVPETAHLDEVLREMKTRRIHIAIVHDEFGGTAGLITLEDIIEEIVGDIYDEYDPEAQPIEWLDDETALLDARTSVEDVNEALGTTIPEEAGYETLGGYLFHELGRPGRAGEMLVRYGVEFKLERVANRRILAVRAHRTEAFDGEGGDGEGDADRTRGRDGKADAEAETGPAVSDGRSDGGGAMWGL